MWGIKESVGDPKQDSLQMYTSTSSCKGSGGPMVKVSALQPQDCGFEPHTGQIHDSPYAHMTPVLVPGSGLEIDLYKLSELASQSSKNKHV